MLRRAAERGGEGGDGVVVVVVVVVSVEVSVEGVHYILRTCTWLLCSHGGVGTIDDSTAVWEARQRGRGFKPGGATAFAVRWGRAVGGSQTAP